MRRTLQVCESPREKSNEQTFKPKKENLNIFNAVWKEE